MKEIWKLLELLNEYDKEKWLHTFWKMTQSNKIQIYGKWVCSESYLYSKSYGFIKWLVENDKIDQTNKFCVSVNVEWKGMGYTKAFEGYESLLMLLAIQDEPIRFLCEILK